jgi:hypothetical protein
LHGPTGEGHLETPAAEGPRGDVLRGGAVQYEKRTDAPGQRRLPAQEAHSAEVALALLADVRHQQHPCMRVLQAPAILERSRDCQERGEARAIVRNARSSDLPVRAGDDLILIAGSDHSVEVRGDCNVRFRSV